METQKDVSSLIDLGALDDEMLDALALAVESERQKRAKNRLERLKAEIAKAAKVMGMEPQQVINSLVAPKAKAGGGRRNRKNPPKYQDPDNPSNTYSGVGTYPRWLREKLDAGAKLEDFLIREERKENDDEIPF